MSVTISFEITMRCPRHPRYNPCRGLGAIKGGCVACTRMFQIYMTSILALSALIKEVERGQSDFGFIGRVIHNVTTK